MVKLISNNSDRRLLVRPITEKNRMARSNLRILISDNINRHRINETVLLDVVLLDGAPIPDFVDGAIVDLTKMTEQKK